MKVEEAIVIKETPEPGYSAIPIRDRRVANNLSIEALKAIKCGREGLRTEFSTPLLGED